MKKVISFKSKFGWISASEENNKILSVSFGKLQSRGTSNKLKKLIKDNKEGEWEDMVPEGVDEIIKEKCLFGYNCEIN